MRARSDVLFRYAGLAFGIWCASQTASWAQEIGTPPAGDNDTSWQRYDWISPLAASNSNESFHAGTASSAADPFTVLSTGQLWQEAQVAVYTRKVDSGLNLNCETSHVNFDGNQDGAASREDKLGFEFSPAACFSLNGNCHSAATDAFIPADSTTTTGASLTAVGHLPTKTTLIVGLDSDRTATNAATPATTRTSDYDAQLQQPLGSLPLSAVLKSHYVAATGTTSPTSLPSLEQSVVWKPMSTATVQMGLRQQQYQEYPGVDHQLNEALFADWSQQVLDNVSWHSYAEVLNSRGLIDQAPASSISTGANGTAQGNNPLANTSPTSSLPLSLDDQTLTFSTGPSVQLQKDLSANFEFSNRWDKNPTGSNPGQEQRVSVSVKGSF
jgi:hypothetical protein